MADDAAARKAEKLAAQEAQAKRDAEARERQLERMEQEEAQRRRERGQD